MAGEFSVIGKRFPRNDALEKVNGRVQYTTDIKLPGMLHAKFLRSPHAHARIVSIDTSRAEALPGVKAVLTHKNVPKVHPIRELPPAKFEYLLDETVHYAGEEVAAVAAISEEIAEEALKFIEVQYEVLPAVFDKEEAMKPGAPLVHPELGTNLSECPRTVDGMLPLDGGDINKGFAEADYIIEDVYESPLVHPMSPEPRCAVCQWIGDNLTCWVSTQFPQKVRRDQAECLGIPLSKVRSISTYSVGGYGAKDPQKIATLTSIMSKRTGRPVRAVFTRAEDFIATHRCIDTKCYARLGVKKDGKITAFYVKMISNYGRDSTIGHLTPATGASTTFCMLYQFENFKFEGYHVITNIIDHGALNGFGDPEAGFCLERMVDEAAEKIGIDPLEFRLRNCLKGGGWAIDVPAVLRGPVVRGVVSSDLDSFPECIRKVAEQARWKEKWKGWGTPMAVNGSKRRGIGIALGIHHCQVMPTDSCTVKMNRDGTVDVLSSDPEIGQGIKTAFAQVVAEELGIRYEDVNVVLADTSVTPYGFGVCASRGITLCVNCAHLAAKAAKRKLFKIAAERLGATAEDLEAKNRMIYVKGQEKKSISIAEVSYAAYQITEHVVLPYPFIDEATGKEIVPESVVATIAEVEVDVDTGELNILRLVSAHDCGKAINPTIVENQIDLSLTMGTGWVTTEKLIIDQKTGVVLNPNLLDYKIMTFLDMPKMKDLQEIIVEYPAPWGPFGAKGMSETGRCSPAPAIANAIYNAIGVRIRGEHLGPQSILEALGKCK
jgi:xanthine dehydrogenase molybdenum-binding subunit